MSEEADLLETLAHDLVADLDAITETLEAALTDEQRAAWEEAELEYESNAPRRGLDHDMFAPAPLLSEDHARRSRDPADVAFDHAAVKVRRRSDRIRRLLHFQAKAREAAPAPLSTSLAIAPSLLPSQGGSPGSGRSHAAQGRQVRQSKWWSLLAPAAAALLVLTWVAPLTWGATLGFSVLFVALAVVTVLVYRRNLGATPAIVTILCAIAFFGIVYAVIQLAAGDNPLGAPPDPRLGEAFLIATSMGIAGGVISGALDVGPKIVAHIQLLLLLTVLATALVEAFRSLRRREGGNGEGGTG